jgi:16S rRNA (guanine(527)-N(7))-methyltransferase GidB
MLAVGRSGILKLARAWSFVVPEEIADRIALYTQRLLEWNQRVNLTGARTVNDLLGEHLPDSFALARLVPETSDIVDIGSGGGLPAVPLALLRPDCRITLVEPRAKRVAFLNMVTRVCGCAHVKVVRARLEDLQGSRFSIATSRATFPPEEWLELAPMLLDRGGRAIVLSTGQVRPEIAKPRLVDSIEYRTAGGAPRCAGCYCFT